MDGPGTVDRGVFAMEDRAPWLETSDSGRVSSEDRLRASVSATRGTRTTVDRRETARDCGVATGGYHETIF